MFAKAPLEIAVIYEHLGYALYKFAMQADDRSQFLSRCHEAIESYRNAARTSNRGTGPRAESCMLRCEAMIRYLDFWLSSNMLERRRLINLSHKFLKRTLSSCKADGGYEYVKTFNHLCIVAGFDYSLQTNQQDRESTVRNVIRYGEEAIHIGAGSENDRDLAVALVRLALFIDCLGHCFLDIERRERCTQVSNKYWLRAVSICEEGAMLALLEPVPIVPLQIWGIGSEAAIENLMKGLDYAKKTKDKFAIGCAADWLAFNVYWKATSCANTDQSGQLHAEAVKFAQEARLNYLPLSFVSTRSYSFPVDLANCSYSIELADREPDPLKRQQLLEAAEKYARDGLKQYEKTGYPFPIAMAHYYLGKALLSCAKKGLNLTTKKPILEEALLHASIAVGEFRKFLPLHYFDQAFMIGFMSNVRRELADLAEDEKTKINILEEAAAEKGNSVQLGRKYLPFYEKIGSSALLTDICRWESEYADLLNQLYSLTKNQNHLRKEIEVLRNAGRTNTKFDLPNRAAECIWKEAQIHDVLGERLKASRAYGECSRCYLDAARKIPVLKAYYEEYSSYMQAWEQIEKARYYHSIGKYGVAKSCYDDAARIHEALEHWKHLSLNYSALALIEAGEELSVTERDEDAAVAFGRASELLVKVQNSILIQLEKTENPDKQMTNNLLTASEQSRLYCEARIAIENARIKEKKGDYRLGAEDYALAVETLKRIIAAEQSEVRRQELNFIAGFCDACMKMLKAEDSGSPEVFLAASRQFEQAGLDAEEGRSRGLALGHSRFSMALGAMAKFVDTEDLSMYSEATKSLQSATNYYGAAGLNNAVSRCRAIELLIEAYLHMGNSRREVDPRKKGELCRMAEIVLRQASRCYANAEHVEIPQLQRLLEKAREDHELALLLSQIVRTSPIATETAYITTQLNSEKPVELDKFNRSEIQASISVPSETTVDEELEIHLDIVNTGAKSCQLIKIDDVVPTGIRVIDTKPVLAGIEKGSINIKGKTLQPLMVESFKLRVSFIQPGEITLAPRIVFLDNAETLRVCEPRSFTIIIHPKVMFRSKHDLTEKVFSFLVQAFVNDYMKNKISLNESGWRTLMQIVNQGHIPKSFVYKYKDSKKGWAMRELENRGLVEMRVFKGQRGRGGNVLRTRISYEKETVKRYVDRRVLEAQ